MDADLQKKLRARLEQQLKAAKGGDREMLLNCLKILDFKSP